MSRIIYIDMPVDSVVKLVAERFLAFTVPERDVEGGRDVIPAHDGNHQPAPGGRQALRRLCACVTVAHGYIAVVTVCWIGCGRVVR